LYPEAVMSTPFACPRCGSVSLSRHDAHEGYCGRCRAWTAGDGALSAMSDPEYARYLQMQRDCGNTRPRRVRRLHANAAERSGEQLQDGTAVFVNGWRASRVPASARPDPDAWPPASIGEAAQRDLDGELLTPQVLLADARWQLAGVRGDEVLFALAPLVWPWPGSWRPDASLGAFTATWTDSQLILALPAEIIVQAIMELVYPPGSPEQPRGELLALWQAWRRAGCPQGHPEPVLMCPPGSTANVPSGANLAAWADLAGCSAEAAGQMTARQAFELEREAAWLTRALAEADAGLATPREYDGERGEVFQQASYIPDRCPPPRALPATRAPGSAPGGDAMSSCGYDGGDIFL
jgi:ribosomal protein L37AE/L43A